MINRIGIRITALLTMLAVLIFALPTNVVAAQETGAAPSTDTENTAEINYVQQDTVPLKSTDDYDIFEGTVGATTTIFVAVDRGMTITKLGTTSVTANTKLYLPESSSSEASIQLVEKTTTIATGGETKSYGIRIRGLKTGTISFKVDGVTYTLHVVPNNPSYRQNSKYIKVQVDQIVSSKAYVTINGSELFEITEGMAIDQTFVGGCSLIFFTAPNDGYALTGMGATGSMDQYYALGNGTIGDGTDTDAWPYKTVTDENGNTSEQLDTAHGYHNAVDAITREGLKDLFTRAIKAGCDGTNLFSRLGDKFDLDTKLSFISKKLPEMEINLTYQKKDEKDQWSILANDTVLGLGDKLRFEIQIVTYDEIKAEDMNFSNIELKNNLIKFYLSSNAADEEHRIDMSKLLSGGIYSYVYELSNDDLGAYAGGQVTNVATLTYDYNSKYSVGAFKDSVTFHISCYIEGQVVFAWDSGVPEQIKNNQQLPENQVGNATTEFVFTAQKYEDFQVEQEESGYSFTTHIWKFVGWDFKNLDGTVVYRIGKETGQETATSSMVKYTVSADKMAKLGTSVLVWTVWEKVDCPKYSVTYAWTGLPEGANAPDFSAEEYYANQPFQVDGAYCRGVTISDNGVVYVFGGWQYNGQPVTAQTIAMPEGDITVTGEWKPATSLSIRVEGVTDENEIFLFRIKGDGVELIISVKGSDTVTIGGLIPGTSYAVTELSGWSWRYRLTNETETITLSQNTNTVSVKAEQIKYRWLDDNQYTIAVFNRKETGSSVWEEGEDENGEDA